jgi:hypothetical protein
LCPFTVGNDTRPKHHLLAETDNILESGAKQGLKFFPIELLDVEAVVIIRLIRVDRLVRRRDDNHAVGLENPLDLCQHLLMLVMVFDRLERNHKIDSAIQQRDFRA